MNPIEESRKYLVECGWTEEQAKNLMMSLSSESAEHLWEIAPKWIEYCGEAKKLITLLETVALAPLIRVSHNGKDWNYALRDGVELK
jgi:hypothetical protein